MTATTIRFRDAVPPTARVRLQGALRAYGATTRRFRPPPDFLIIGAKRGGTTSLYRYLAQHPQVVSRSLTQSRFKGAHFFDTGYDKGLAWYESHFPTTAYRRMLERRHAGPVVAGEGSPYYLFHPHAAARAAAAVPTAKLILLLRNPIDRAFSHYKMRRREGAEPLDSFEAALAAEPSRLAGEEARMLADPTYYSAAHENYSYLSQGLYLEPLRRWLSLFPREQVWIGRSEDFYADPQAVTNDVFAFLGLPPFVVPDRDRHQQTAAADLPVELRQRLAQQIAPDNHALEEFLGMEFGWDAA